MIRRLLGRFEAIMAQDGVTALRLGALGAPAGALRIGGSLKAGLAPPDLPQVRAALSRDAAGRPLWLAASTHAGEEAAVAAAHRIAAAAHPGLLTLLAPRHPERGEAIAAALRAEGLTVTRRAAGEAAAGDIHLLDTLGEMGAWLRAAPVAFLGGSLVPRGGHNPHEPAGLGCAIVHGPHVANFAQDYAALTAAGGAREVADGPALGAAVAALLADAQARAVMAAAARAALGDGRAALEATLAAVAPLIPARAP